MLLFGFSSGLPILLVFSTLSVWLSKAGVERSTITLFSWAGFAYAFKYLWSPIIDKFSLPIFKKFGHRRSWLLLVQFLIIFSLILTSFTDPQKNLYATAFFIVLLAFFSASQDIIIDAFRIESVSTTTTVTTTVTGSTTENLTISSDGKGSGVIRCKVTADNVQESPVFSKSVSYYVVDIRDVINIKQYDYAKATATLSEKDLND